MKKELQLFFFALSFYTRIPPPHSFQNPVENSLNQSIKYFPLVGWIVGFVAALVFLLANMLIGLSLAIAFSMISSILLTGAFHEDGFADVCDGFGGGWNKQKIVDIMKDSRVGTYGVVGLIAILSTKFIALKELFPLAVTSPAPLFVILIFITAHALSRFTAATFLFTHAYVQSTNSKANLSDETNKQSLFIAGLFAFIPLLVLVLVTVKPSLLFVLMPLFVLKFYLARYFTKWIGGYTGDCLGATQQLAEVIIFLSFIVLWKFTW